MLRYAIPFACLVVASSLGHRADAETAPKVVTDIAPVHALVARVMQGVGEPDLILPQSASPHSYAMRPSEARDVQNAGLVVWMGPALTPWMEEAIETLAPDTPRLDLLGVEGTVILPTRDDRAFMDHEGAHDHEEHEGHDEHEGHNHEKEHSDEHDHEHDHDHGHAHEDEHDHDHGPEDPHAWLDPENAALWMGVIAEDLARLDPENAATYRANATAGQAEMASLTAEITAMLNQQPAAPFVVSHDALHYFEARFDRPSSGAVTNSDAAAAGAAHLAELKSHMQDNNITCLLIEPGVPTDRLAAIFGDDLRFAEVDILGRNQTLGAELYPAKLRSIAENLLRCTAP